MSWAARQARPLGQRRVDPPLEPIGAVALHRQRREVLRIESGSNRADSSSTFFVQVRHFAVQPAHHPRQRHRPTRVGDDQHVRGELPLVAVDAA